MSKTKKMRNKTFLGIWVPCLTVAAAVAIALPIVAYSYKTILNTYVNHGETIVTPAEGTESWDSTYNKASVKTKAEAVSASESEVEKICNEGFVLLKNKDNSLPISTSTEITMLGRDSVDPIYGGSGSGTVDKTKCATPKSGLEKAGFSINSAAYDFYNSNYTNYPRANIVMDKPDSSTYFAGEIPANTVKAGISPVTGDTAVVFIGRGGGEGGDLSTNLKDDITNTASTKAIADSANAAAEAGKIVAGQHQLELTQDEKDLINWAKTTYAKTVIVLNSSNIMEMGRSQ
jgi:beta-glucosidase